MKRIKNVLSDKENLIIACGIAHVVECLVLLVILFNL